MSILHAETVGIHLVKHRKSTFVSSSTTPTNTTSTSTTTTTTTTIWPVSLLQSIDNSIYAVLSQNQVCRNLRTFGVKCLSWKWQIWSMSTIEVEYQNIKTTILNRVPLKALINHSGRMWDPAYRCVFLQDGKIPTKRANQTCVTEKCEVLTWTFTF